MAITVNTTNMHAFDGLTDLGHAIDAARNDPAIAADVKSALDMAWISNQATIASLQSQLAAALADE